MCTEPFLEEWVRDSGELMGADNTSKAQKAMKKGKEILGHN